VNVMWGHVGGLAQGDHLARRQSPGRRTVRPRKCSEIIIKGTVLFDNKDDVLDLVHTVVTLAPLMMPPCLTTIALLRLDSMGNHQADRGGPAQCGHKQEPFRDMHERALRSALAGLGPRRIGLALLPILKRPRTGGANASPKGHPPDAHRQALTFRPSSAPLS